MVPPQKKRVNAIPQMMRRLIFVAALRHQQLKLVQHAIDYTRLAVIPRHNALRGVGPA